MLVFLSCKKDTSIETDCGITTTHIADNYMPLQDSNYWVYERCHLDTLGNKSCSPLYDTVFVLGDEIINGITYKKLKKNGFTREIFPEYLREKNGEIFTPEYDDTTRLLTGNELIIFSSTKDTLSKLKCRYVSSTTPASCFWKESKYMVSGSTVINVPAGNLLVRNAQNLYVFDYDVPYWGNTRTRDFQFSKNIGLVRNIIFFSRDPDITECNLVSYKLN
jgi:hypothetical protein